MYDISHRNGAQAVSIIMLLLFCDSNQNFLTDVGDDDIRNKL